MSRVMILVGVGLALSAGTMFGSQENYEAVLAMGDLNIQFVSIPQFDPGLGTLNSVNISFTPDEFLSVTVDNNGSGPADFSGFDAFATFTLTGPGGTTITSALLTDNAFGNSIPAGGALTEAVNNFPNYNGNAADPSDYVGSGNVTFYFSANGLTNNGLLPTGGIITNDSAEVTSGDLSVTYNYTPAATPEPASIGLVTIGLAGLGFFARKREPKS